VDLYHSIIGLPFSGKTTFLAALWHLIDAGEIETRLVLDHLEGDKRYLNSIAKSWRECKRVGRTSMSGEVDVSIHARIVQTGQQIVLGFPDLSGESFARQFATRRAKTDYVEGFNREGGMLLFISANKSTDGLTIADLGPELLDAVEAPDTTANEGIATQPAVDALVDWKYEMVPQQAQLVDLLQMLQSTPFEIRRRKLAVIVSAWDVVPDPDLRPAQWLAREMPLVFQYLAHNPESFDFKVWGVSAQGGDISGGDRQKLLSMTPSERVRCIGEESQSSDITAPISWLSEAL